MFKIYVYIFDTLADWELGYVTAELNSGRFFKKDAPRVSVKTVGISKESVKTMGGMTIVPDCVIDDMKRPTSGGSPGTKRSIPWTVRTGLNTRPACMSPRPRSFWNAWSCLSGSGTPSTPCRRSRAAGSMLTSFLAKASKRLPRPRVCMRSPSANLSNGAWNA